MYVKLYVYTLYTIRIPSMIIHCNYLIVIYLITLLVIGLCSVELFVNSE